MRRLVMSLAALIAAAVGLLWPLAAGLGPSSQTVVDPVVITDYRADYQLARNGELSATETLTTEFPGGKHGIFRFWDLSDAGDVNKGVRYRPEDIRVSMDGQSVPFEMSTEQQGRFEVARIGDPNVLVAPGTHTYQISYRVAGTIADGDPGRFVWRVVANGWQMRMDHTTSTIQFPEPPRRSPAAPTTARPAP